MSLRLMLVLACGLVGACGADSDGVPTRRDVVLVIIDTLRADFVGISGDAPYTATPEIDRIARNGRWFCDAWASAPWTPPSVMSLMTSLEPPVHGLDLEGHLLSTTVPSFPAGAATLAGLLRADGYRTLAVTAGGGVGSVFGFDRGFERFYEPESRPAQDVEDGVDRALDWIAEPDPRPTFLFFHTYEVHLPNTHAPCAIEGDPAGRARAAYAGDLAVADRHLGRLFRALEADERLRRALIVITSDHGENLHDRILGGRPVDHGHHLHAELLRVPLIMVAQGLIPPAGEIDGPARLLDVLPTICSLLDVDISGVPHQGQDLRPALLGEQSIDPTPLFGWAPLQGPTWGAIRTGEWTYLRSPEVDTNEWWGQVVLPIHALYHRSSDPDERDNVVTEQPDVARQLAERMTDRAVADHELRQDLGVTDAVAVSAGDALRELGYLDRGPPSGG